MLLKNKAYRDANPEKYREWVKANPDKVKAAGQRYRVRNRDKLRQRKYALRYGITVELYQELLEQQNGVCAICGQNGRKVFHVDHEHETGRVRGLLCRACNHGLGQFCDDPERLRAAARYLETSQTKT